MTDRPERTESPWAAGTPRRWRDLAMILPAFGLVLFMPPVIGLFVSEYALFGVPSIVVYVFGAWAALIAVAALINRRLSAPARSRADDERPP
ncbi:hypothetical protein [uncultured Rhodospira sp.]|uniref:hypothetical protein n=1 Tax=uncultured Rhodospira sp. TaxID=1936189 RepID=UPI002636A19E|nr:hypothetical protein [uncultured Rhodospira sp.]